MAFGDKPFGLRDVKVTNSTGTTQVDLPAGMKLSFSERMVSDEFKGDDSLLGVVAFSEAVEWELENGGISLAAYALMTGRSAVAAGSQPNRTLTLTGEGGQSYPYFKVYGKAISDDGSDVHCKLFKCKLTKMEGTFENAKFWTTAISGLAIDDGTNGIFEFVQNETEADLPTT
jgi:hypothetical protein